MDCIVVSWNVQYLKNGQWIYIWDKIQPLSTTQSVKFNTIISNTSWKETETTCVITQTGNRENEKEFNTKIRKYLWYSNSHPAAASGLNLELMERSEHFALYSFTDRHSPHLRLTQPLLFGCAAVLLSKMSQGQSRCWASFVFVKALRVWQIS